MSPNPELNFLAKVLFGLGILLLVALLLTSCASADEDELHFTEDVRLVDVEGVTCVLASGYQAIAIDCNWFDE